ncbi:hypothetical protein C8J56DRAFT_925596 [Mycena floridula]|nr:hypothetical protein C8J56DRAFT_925596 [Mycena floridula]
MDRLPWLSTASNARVVVISGLKDDSAWWSQLPVQSTQFLFLETQDLSRAIATLPKFHNIISSGLKCCHYDYSDPFAYKSQSLHHLSSTIYCFNGNCTPPSCRCFDNILSSFTLHGLKSLRLAGSTMSDCEQSCWSQLHFFDFLDRSAIHESLTSLTFDRISGLTDDHLLEVFQSLPFLTRLTILALGNEVIFSVLIKLADSSTLHLLPRLKFLDVQIDQEDEAIHAVAGLVGARYPPIGQLKEIVVRMEVFHSETMEESRQVKLLQDSLETFSGTRHIIKCPGCSKDEFEFAEWVEEVRIL